MKRKVTLKNILGVIFLVLFAGLIIAFGYRALVSAKNKPGKLCSIPDSANQANSPVCSMEEVKKVTYDTMKYGYMDNLMLAQMDHIDHIYESERMEEIRAVNNLTAMSEKTMDKLAYEKAAAEYEEYKKQARTAALAAEEAKKAKAKEISDRRKGIVAEDGSTDGGSDSGSGDTASKGGKNGKPVFATSHGKSLGTYVITAYCTCRICCGVYSGGNRTASGTVPTSNRTLAVDTSVIPFGTKLVINGQVYVAEDRGGAIKGKRIDMFFMTHKEALNWGRKSVEVFLAE